MFYYQVSAHFPTLFFDLLLFLSCKAFFKFITDGMECRSLQERALLKSIANVCKISKCVNLEASLKTSMIGTNHIIKYQLGPVSHSDHLHFAQINMLRYPFYLFHSIKNDVNQLRRAACPVAVLPAIYLESIFSHNVNEKIGFI